VLLDSENHVAPETVRRIGCGVADVAHGVEQLVRGVCSHTGMGYEGSVGP
jgi:hypothetical protein